MIIVDTSVFVHAFSQGILAEKFRNYSIKALNYLIANNESMFCPDLFWLELYSSFLKLGLVKSEMLRHISLLKELTEAEVLTIVPINEEIMHKALEMALTDTEGKQG